MGPEEQRAQGSRGPSEQFAPLPAADVGMSDPAQSMNLPPPRGDLSSLSKLTVPSVRASIPEASSEALQQAQHGQARADMSAAQQVDHARAQSSESSNAATLIGAIKKLGTAIGSTVCFSLTGVFNQAARGETTDVSKYPDPFLYCVLRSSVASIVTYLKDRTSFENTGFLRAFKEIGTSGRLMCGLMAANNVLWIPAFMLTDLASAIVIGGAQPFVHSIYESVRAQKLPSALKLTGLGLTAAALSTIVVNQSGSSVHYPHAVWGNLAAFTASMCFVTYMTINNRVVESARSRAVSAEEVEAAKQIASAAERKEKEKEFESIRTDAQKSAQAKLRAVPFFSQVASAVAGLALFAPQVSAGVFSGGLGISPINTVIMGTLHGVVTAAGLYLRTLATQTNKPSVVSLVAGVQVGLTPLFGYLLFGSTVPQFAIVAGTLALCSSLTSVAEVHYAEKQRQKSAGA